MTFKPLTALGHALPIVEVLGPLTLTERVDVALASLAVRRGREAELRALASDAGLPLPAPGRAEAGQVWSTFWMTPEMWMVEAPDASHEDIRAHLLNIFGGAVSVTEQTDAWVRFDLSGPAPERVFERLSNVDLAQAAAGTATRTLIEHLGCYLIRRSADLVTVLGPRSSALSLHHGLRIAMHSVL